MSAQVDQPNAVVVSTVLDAGIPASRTVLVKSWDDRGFVFYTNYGSDKGNEISCNPSVALLFLWIPLHRQVRITGTAGLVDDTESDLYFASRPLDSQIGAVISPQSTMIPDRKWLETRFAEVKEELDGPLPRPEDWGGYRIRPTRFEFWQGRRNRLHDRILYTPGEGGWDRSRLAP